MVSLRGYVRRAGWGSATAAGILAFLLIVTARAETPATPSSSPPSSPPIEMPPPEKIQIIVDRITEIAAKSRHLDTAQRAEFHKRCGEAFNGLVRQYSDFRLGLVAICQEEMPEEGIWPTKRQFEVVLERLVDGMVPDYDLDARQRDILQDRMRKVVLPLVEKRREQLEAVIMGGFIQYVSGEMPTTQQVSEWSKQVVPLVAETGKTWEEMYRFLLPHLRSDQRRILRKAYFEFGLGLKLAEAKVRSWAKGKFDRYEFEKPFPGPHHGPHATTRFAKQAGVDINPPPEIESDVLAEVGHTKNEADGMPGQPEDTEDAESDRRYIPLDRWQSYTKAFIKRHHLDEGQKTSALAILADVRQRARNYEQAHTKELKQLRRTVRKSKGEERTRVQEDLNELEQPLHELLDELRSRLDETLRERQQ